MNIAQSVLGAVCNRGGRLVALTKPIEECTSSKTKGPEKGPLKSIRVNTFGDLSLDRRRCLWSGLGCNLVSLCSFGHRLFGIEMGLQKELTFAAGSLQLGF